MWNYCRVFWNIILVTVRSFFRCQQIKCVACYCENPHHSRIKPFQVFLRGSCGAWSVQMSHVCVKFQARSQVNVASCNVVFPVKTVGSPHTGCKHHSVTPKLLLRSASEFFESPAPVGWWYRDRTVLGSVPQPRGRLQHSNGLQHTDLDRRTAQPLRSEKFKPALDYLLQQVCAQSVLLALGMHETFIVVGSLGFEMKAEAPEQWMERKRCLISSFF